MRAVMVAPAVEAPLVIGLDVGGSKILSGLVHPANRMLRIVPAELGPEAGLVGSGLVVFETLDGLR
jgi:hypothetical protein